MCTFAIFPDTKVGPVIGFCMDDAVDYADAPGFGTLKAPRCPANGIYRTEAGGGAYDYETESQQIFPFEPPVGKCQNLDDVERLLMRYRHFPKRRPRHVGFIDLNTRQTLLAEQSWSDAHVWRTADGVAFNTSGGPETPQLRKLCDPQNVRFKRHDVRMASMCRALKDSQNELSVETMWRMFLGHEYEGAVCQHEDTRPPGVYPITLMMWVMTPALGKLWVRFYTDGRPPCKSEPTEISFDPWRCEAGGALQH